MQILKPEETSRLFEIEADVNKDRALQLPVIALSRNKDIELLCTKKQPRTFNAIPMKIGDTPIVDPTTQDFNATVREAGSIGKKDISYISMNVIPMKIGYQLDLYTKGMSEADEYIRNFVFNFINYPKLTVELPYLDLKLQHNATITLEESVTDNSDIKEHLFADQFVRFTLRLDIDDAYFFSLPEAQSAYVDSAELDSTIPYNPALHSSFEVMDRITKEIVETQKLF